MSTSAFRVEPRAVDARCTDDALVVRLADGRELTVPLEWFPRLREAPPAARQNWRLIGGGVGLHWPDLDEDLSVAGLLAGR
ncbi:MAG TPA: DUF2442 domain-containing protein [Gemmatimonadaceae bacterium]|jgi:hypothetical protein|nr:DUF2442 domain-containing protein [Gemmatimonadaceae bacterium]